MFVGALLDLGVSLPTIQREIGKLKLTGLTLDAYEHRSRGVTGTKFDVRIAASHQALVTRQHARSARDFAAIKKLISASRLDAEVKRRALSVFQRIAVAEGKIHGVPVEKVHFHEIGAADSIADIVAACVAMRELGADRVIGSRPILTGSGFVDCDHGRFPVPAPAALEILKGVELAAGEEKTELLTPTGAALLREFCDEFGSMPPMRVEKIGYGIGTKMLEKTPNVLRTVLGDVRGREILAQHSEICVIETNLDDCSPQLLGDAMEQLLAAGALDVYYTPVQMKKNRPAVMLTVLCEPSKADALAEWVLTNTTTFGVRMHTAQRRCLAREIVKVKTKLGAVEVKVGRLGDRVVSASPEFESCRKLARAAKVPLKRVVAAALAKAEELYG